jgi:hypothetical protein
MPLQNHVDNGPTVVVHREPCDFCGNPSCQLIFSQNDLYFFEESTRCNHESSQLRDCEIYSNESEKENNQ